MTLRLIPTLAVWVVLAALPTVLGLWELAMFGQLLIYGIAAISLAFIWGQGGLVSFGQALFFGAGAYAMSLTAKGMLPGIPESPWLGLLLAVVAGAVFGALTGVALFFGKGLRTAYFGIITIAAAVIAERVTTNWRYIGGFNGLLDVPPLPLPGGLDSADPLAGYLLVLGFALLAFLFLLAVERSPFGTVLRGIRCDERRIMSLGYFVPLWKVMALALSGGVAGLAGGLFAAQFAFVSPAVIGLALSTEILIWAAVGGKAVLMAAFIGAIFVKYMEGYLSETIGNYWLLVTGIAFIAVVVLFPEGLLGRIFKLPPPARLRRD
ncbi:branched-chain amino acid ABC transporter permease [Kaistia nematophila]|uniref:Branched-chain amino acid ABC transporter permease n=1 Tax=Kaistia nematophila TaxID=2994654 RepID=A0A9X3ILL9_9HYPH|nr:branched-chain amino acid ABC transporter permease [Kaistia nematophila]MCX5570663.1 branched-chain amino acid ABC transporter permease [Kaistia nematophila]